MQGTLQMAAQHMGGKLHGSDGPFMGLSTDTRSLAEGELFFALQGPNFDGSSFVAAAADKSAAGAVVSSHSDIELPQIVVDDARLALGRLAREWRASLDTTVVGVTGSNGKTTIKVMLAVCLSQVAATLATRGNLNNDIGLPLMVLELNEEHRYAVLEMGANHKGEIGYLASVAKPQVAVISNAGPAHLEGFGSLDGVAAAKGELLQTQLDAAVLNADDKYFSFWSSLAKANRVISFGMGPHADVYASSIELVATGSHFDLHIAGETVHVNLHFIGEHNVLNACAAAAAAFALGVDIQQIKAGLEGARPFGGRLRVVGGVNGSIIYDDSYNANPTSILAAARFIASLPGTSFLALGDMGELGSEAVALHAEVGAAAYEAGIDRLFATGKLMRHAVDAFAGEAHWYPDKQELIAALQASLDSSTTLLVKGSRFMGMESVVDTLQDDAQVTGKRRESR